MSGDSAAIKALKGLSAVKSIPSEEFKKHAAELAGDNDRLVAVVGGSAVEAAIEGRLRNEMRELTGVSENDLFGGNGVLGTFSAKIALAYAFKLISNDTRRNADYIRHIRNTFAHCMRPISFRTPEVANVCRLLHTGERKMSPKAGARARYFYAVIATGTAVWRDVPPA